MKTVSFGKTGLFRTFFFLFIFLFTKQLSAFGPCDSIKFTLENYQPCCFRLHVDNSLLECYDELLLFIDAGTYSSFQANPGWTVDQISPNEILIKHSSGRIPKGVSIPGTFCLEPGFDPLLSITWANTCDLLGCFRDIPLKGCTIVADACILGVKYRECNQAVYSNQTPIPNFTINLLDNRGIVISSTVTDSAGEYSFCDLAPGNYIVREVSQAGWTSNIPASGQYAVTLLQSEIVTRNFGNCPVCSCDSIYVDIVEDGGDSDTCSYTFVIQNTGGYCFQKIKVKATTVDIGKSNTFRTLEPGWILSQIDTQNLELIPPGGYIPKGVSYPLNIRFYIGSTEPFKFTVTTYYQNGSNQQECNKEFFFTCPKIKPPANCCPTGTTQGAELAINGNFETPGTGPIGFTDCFPWFNPGSTTSVGSYSVLQSNQVFAANAQWACTDHTASLPTGKMLIVDGQNTNCGFVWQELVNVQPGEQYAFCVFVNNLVIPTKNFDDPIVELWINNTQVQTITLTESPDQWKPLNALWPSGTNTSTLLQIRLGAPTVVGNDFAVDDISFRKCKTDTCLCGPFDLQYSIGRGPLLPYYCGDTLSVPASAAILPIHFLSAFTCLGTNCPQVTVDLILTGPPGFIPITISGVQAIPDFIIPFTNSTFSIAGLYTLTINGHCGSNNCPCIIYFKADGHDCCSNQFDFELGISNNVTISVDNNKCKATLNIVNLPKCDSIGPIFWGDGTSTQGIFFAGSMPMHTYGGNGTYYITWTATEYDYFVMPPRKCFEKVFRDSITLVCDTCQCKSFSPLSFVNPSWPGYGGAVICGGPSVQLPCLKPAQYFTFHGNLNCNAKNCVRDSIHWNIVQTTSGQLVSSGTASLFSLNPNSSAHFDIPLNILWFSSGIQYTINVGGQCGSNICTCKVNFSFADCPCPCDSIVQDVFQGFYVGGNQLSCNRKVKPASLCPNDLVNWQVNPSITPAPVNSIGNNSQIIHFTNPGIYTVCMNVMRIDPVKLDTCRESYCRKVTVNCFPNPSLGLCATNAIKNGDFTEGLVKGELSKSQLAKSRGKIANWELFPNDGDGFVLVTDSSGISDDGQVILIGNKNNFAGIWQEIDLPVDNYINIGFNYLDYRRNKLLDHLLAYDLVVRLQNDSTLNASNQVVLLKKKDPGKKDEDKIKRVDTSINLQHNPELKYLVICLQNDSETEFSIVGLDNFELCSSKVPLSTHTEEFLKLRIYPNPSNGIYTIEMQQDATAGMSFRIIDLTGRNVLEKQTTIGNQIQNIDASKLASGFYFLQVISKGKVLAVEKLMKE